MISIIAAIGKNRELGKDNKLLWYIPEDFKKFKDLTSGHVVIMGRKTFESLPEKFRPLPNRVNIVVTRDLNFTISARSYKDGKVIICHSLEEALRLTPLAQGKPLKNLKSKDEVFIIGGASIYEQGIKYADRLYLTLVDKTYPDADAFFPKYDEFKVVKEEKHQNKEYAFMFVEFIRQF